MLVLRLWSGLTGYVIIRVKGSALERLVNLAASRGVRLYDIRRVNPDVLYAQTSVGGFKALRPLARRLSCTVRIRRKGGLPFLLETLVRRKALTAGVFLFLAALYALSSFVWFIQLTGAAPAHRQDILAFLRGRGLKVGAPLGRVDRDRLATDLLHRYPNLTWASIEPHGTLVRVEVVEKIRISSEEQAPRHLVARQDGLVTAVVPLRGESLVKPGDTVVRGQVLISGVVPAEQGLPVSGPAAARRAGGWEYLRAEGSVRARVWHEALGVAPLSGVRNVPTGRRRTAYGLRVGSATLWLGPRSAPFRHSRAVGGRRPLAGALARNIGFPVELLSVTHVEVRVVHYHRGAGVAREEAAREAETKVRRLAGRAKLLKATRETEETSSRVLVRLLWEVEDEIQMARPLRVGEAPPEGLTLPEKKGQGSEPRE